MSAESELINIACENDTRHGFAAIMWESYRRLNASQRAEVMRSIDRGPCSYSDDELIDELAELLR